MHVKGFCNSVSPGALGVHVEGFYTSAARTCSVTRVLLISYTDFQRLAESNPKDVSRIFKNLVKRTEKVKALSSVERHAQCTTHCSCSKLSKFAPGALSFTCDNANTWAGDVVSGLGKDVLSVWALDPLT
eukprot:625632-Pelagomonas_calceolata.AAC.1